MSLPIIKLIFVNLFLRDENKKTLQGIGAFFCGLKGKFDFCLITFLGMEKKIIFWGGVL